MERRKDNDVRKVLAGVLDGRTLRNLYAMSRKLNLDKFYGFVKQGKESSVLLAENSEGRVLAVKIYAVESADFKKIKSYLMSDPRFENSTGNNWSIISYWAKKEFKNLHIAFAGGVNCPEPFGVRENVLIMGLVGNGTDPAPRLINYQADEILGEKIILQMKKLYEAGLVHGDLSPYNILVHNDEPYIIDMSQSVSKKSNTAEEYLKRDIENMCKYLNKIGLKWTEDELMKEVIQ